MSLLDRLRSRRPADAREPRASRPRMEQRAPKAATHPVTWVTPGRPMVPEWDAHAAIRRAYYANVFVYRCVQLRALAAAGLPIRVGADPSRPEDHNPNAPLARFLNNNPAVGRRQLIAQLVAQYDVTGRAAWELEIPRGGGRPLRAYPLTSAYLDPIPTTEPGVTDYWAGFWYQVASPDGPYKELTADQVYYAWRPAMHDFRQPESVLQAQRLNVSVAVMLDRYKYSFLLNDARPAAAVVVQAFEELDELERFKQEWRGEYGGPDNAGKVAVVEAQTEDGPADASKWLHVETLGLTQRDAQVMETYQQELRAITVGFGIDLSLLGDTAGRTFDNADQAHRNFWELTMLPLLEEHADHINRRLAPLFGSDVLWFDTSGVAALKAPSKFQVPVLADLVGKVVTVNEARAEVGLPPSGRPEDDELTAPAPPAETVPAAAGQPAASQDDAQDDSDGETQRGARERRATAAAGYSVMVALYPPADVAATLAQPGGEPVDDLHLTLAFLGPLDQLPEDAAARLRTLLAGWAQTAGPLAGEINGTGQFTLEGGERVTWASVDAPALPRLRESLVDALDAAGLAPRTDHGFTPHITLRYGPGDPVELDPTPVTFDAVTLAVGPARWTWPLAAPAAHSAEDRARDPHAGAERRAAEWRAVDAQARTLERTWERQLRDLFAQQERATLDRLTGKRGRQAMRREDLEERVLGIFDVTFWAARAAELFRALLEGVFALGAGRVARRFPLAVDLVEGAFDPEQPHVRQFILARANQLSGRVTDATYRQIQQALIDGTVAGEGIDEIAVRVRRVFTVASQTRAATIARTEVIGASNASADLVAGQLPPDVVAGREWLATPDHRTRPDHREMDGAVVSMGEMFMVGEPPFPMPHPGWPSAPPDQTVNCRCTVAYLSPEELADRGERHRPRLVELRAALGAVDLVADGVIEPEHITRILEVTAA